MHDTTREKKRDTKVTRERSPHVDLLCNAGRIVKVKAGVGENANDGVLKKTAHF